MQEKKADSVGGGKGQTTLHVGRERVKSLTDYAIEVSYNCGRQITPGQFNQYLIDNFSEAGKAKLLKENPKT